MLRRISLVSILLLLSVSLSLPMVTAASDDGEGILIAVLDRIEEDKAVIILEDGSYVVLPSSLLGSNLQEGDCVNLSFLIDEPRRKALEQDASLGLDGLIKGPR